MSADNYIAIQKRKNKWWVWMEFASNNNPSPRGKCSAMRFRNKYKAYEYAMNWYMDEAVVEYGVQVLPKVKK